MLTGKCGSSGGWDNGGKPFSDGAIQEGESIHEVRIWSGDKVDAVQVVARTKEGVSYELEKHGGAGGQEHVLPLDLDEYITGISGKFGEFVDSICIHTNKKQSTHFGGQGGYSYYEYTFPEGEEVIGFFGRGGELIDSIGVIHRLRADAHGSA